jgi:VanZ family protein
LLALCGLFITYGTLLPFDFSATWEQVETRRHQFLAQPLAGASRTDVVSNVLLFLPWGGLVAVWLTRRRAGLGTALVAGTASGFTLSGLVEALQLLSPSRTSSWIDLATNTAGSALGVVLGWSAAHVISPGVEAELKSRAARRPLAALTAVTALGVLLASLAPFDVSLDVGDLKASVKAARLLPFGPPVGRPAPAAEPWAWAGEVLVWTMFGGLCALALKDARFLRLRGVGLTVVTVAGLSTVIELAQLAIPSRRFDATSIALAAVGAAVGAFVVLRGARRTPRDWVIPALILWALAVPLEAWTPPRFGARGVRDLSGEMLVPFLAYYRRTDIHALADVVVQTMRYVPLGALLALRHGRESGWRAGAIGLGVGLVLEVGQFFIADRTPEITDALSGAVGSWLGCVLAKYAAAALGPALEARGEARYSYSVAGRAPAPPADGRSGPARGDWRDDARRFVGDIGRVARARMPKGGRRALGLILAGLAWLDAQSDGVRIAAVCAGVFVLMMGCLALLRALGQL